MRDTIDIVCPDEIWAKWSRWAQLARPNEVAAFGIGERREDGCIHILDLLLPKQAVTGASVECEAPSVAQAYATLRRLSPDGMVWWIHYHVDMAANWSGTDRESIEAMAREGAGHPILATVANSRGESTSVVAIGGICPVLAPARLVIGARATDPAWDADFEACVKRPSVARAVTTRRAMPLPGNAIDSAITHIQTPYHGRKERPSAVLGDVRSRLGDLPSEWRRHVRELAEAEAREAPDTYEGAAKMRARMVKELEEIQALEAGIVLEASAIEPEGPSDCLAADDLVIDDPTEEEWSRWFERVEAREVSYAG